MKCNLKVISVGIKKREIKSFVLREGRMTKKQGLAFERHWDTYGIEITPGKMIDFKKHFNNNPVFLEIGFGMGESLLHMAEHNPDCNYVGIEVHRPGVGSVLNEIHERNLTNLKVVRHDAVEVLKDCLDDNALEGCYILFPDPWHKRKHHKRRLINTHFLTLLSPKIKTGGFVYVATDWEEYALCSLSVLTAHPRYTNSQLNGGFSSPVGRVETKFERRGKKLGHAVYDLIFDVNNT
jgi:tRNA (guanine-N7-)-methyltransferase